MKLERNARAYEDELHNAHGALAKLKINAVHKATNPTASVADEQTATSKMKSEQEALKMATQNAEDIKKIQKEQLIIKDQLQAVSNALNNFGADMRGLWDSVERLRYEPSNNQAAAANRSNEVSKRVRFHIDSILSHNRRLDQNWNKQTMSHSLVT